MRGAGRGVTEGVGRGATLAEGAAEAAALAEAAAASIFARTERRIATMVPAIAVQVTTMKTTRIFPAFPPDGLDADVDGEVAGEGEGVSMRGLLYRPIRGEANERRALGSARRGQLVGREGLSAPERRKDDLPHP